MLGWIAFGVAFAAACVIAAFLLRPQPPVSSRAPSATMETPAVAETAASGGQEPEVAAPIAGDPALDAIASVRLRVGAELAAPRREALVAALRQIGIDDVRVETLEIAIAASRVGFYRAEDRAAAEALAAAMAPVVTGGAAIAVRDYGALAPSPEPGRLDLWVRD